jgi:ADP-ribosylation factor GTPase-activating protein 2/3
VTPKGISSNSTIISNALPSSINTTAKQETIGEATAKAASLSPTMSSAELPDVARQGSFSASGIMAPGVSGQMPPSHPHSQITPSSAILKPNKRSLGAKKAAKGISFEEAQKLAKEEEEKRLKKEEEEKKRLAAEALSAPVVNHFATGGLSSVSSKPSFGSLVSGNSSKVPPPKIQGPADQADRLGMGMAKLGFGFQGGNSPGGSTASAGSAKPNTNGGAGMSLKSSTQQQQQGGWGTWGDSNPSKAPTSTPSMGMSGGGFGSISGTGNSSTNGEAQQKFGNAKAISSDQYFGRGHFDESQNAEARARLQGFQGRSGFGSSEYYGRNEEEDMSGGGRSSMSNGGGGGPHLGDAANQFVSTFVSQASEDIESLKQIVSEGSSRLGDILSDIKVSIETGPEVHGLTGFFLCFDVK